LKVRFDFIYKWRHPGGCIVLQAILRFNGNVFMVVAQPINMQYNVNKYVRASEAASYYLCPRRVYFERRRPTALTEAEVRAGVFKSISYALGMVVSSMEPEEALEEAIYAACTDALTVYGMAHEQTISKARMEARGRAGEILAGLLKEKERLGGQGLARLLSPASISKAVYSDRLRMSGAIDKVVYGGGGPEPIVISASLPPPEGVYASDRIRLAAYAMLLAEKYNADCPGGAVEYVMGWCLRHAEVRHEDKRKVLYARNRVLEFNDGAMPDSVKGKWCGRCRHYDACSVKATLLDSLFKRRT
jgi:CRISPR-associated exonuclease Cas4